MCCAFCRIFFFSYVSIVFVMKVGSFAFNIIIQTPHPYSFPSILSTIIGLIHYLIPSEKINKHLFKIQKVDETTEYSEASMKFDKVK